MAINMYDKVIKRSKYYDRTLFNSYEEWAEYVNLSKTVYVGNLSVYTTDREIFEYMSKVGPVETVIVGLHRVEKTPCGFCFVVYKTKESCEMAVNILNETILDGRVIKVDEDIGIIGERRYGRGITGVQRIDERLKQFDFDRPVVLDNLIQTESLGDHINSNSNSINNNKNYNSTSSSTSSIITNTNNNNYNHNNNYNNNYNNNSRSVYLRTNEDYVDIKNNSNFTLDNSNHRLNTVHFNNNSSNNSNNNFKYKNNNNIGYDIAESVFDKHQIHYSGNNNYNYDDEDEDEDSADKKHERFKAVQRINRMKIEMLEINKEEVDNTLDIECQKIERNENNDDMDPTNTNNYEG